MGSSRRTTVGRPAGLGRGFTVVEILVVLGIVIGVISTLVVGLGFAARRARVANTEFLMNSIVAGLTRFRAETGYIPPILGDPSSMSPAGSATPFGTFGWCRDVVASPAASNGANLQKWFSATTIPEYLIGLGDRSQDGYGVIMESNGALPTDTSTPGYREQPTLGIRNPGQDGAWGAEANPRPNTAGNGLFASRNVAVANAALGNKNYPVSTGVQRQTSQFLVGKSLGPYIEVKAESELGGLVRFQNGIPIAAKTGDSDYSDRAPKCLLDYFGKPILFYRRGYLNKDPRSTDTSWSLADIIALRPQRFQPGDAIDAYPDSGTQQDRSASRDALAAEFALFSSGPDQSWDPNIRVDPAGYNEDNIVRFGP